MSCIEFDFKIFSHCEKHCSFHFLLASQNPFECSCGIPCEEIEYTTQVSFSEFPDDGAAKILKHNHAYNKSMEYQR